MWHKLLRESSLYQALLSIDEELAREVRSGGCPCGGALHRADYPRKPRGGPEELPSGYESRFSFCCAVDGCRRRRTPSSVRYLGRRVYLGVVVVLLTALTEGVSPRRAAVLRSALGVCRRTLERWRSWWKERFVATPFWKEARGRLLPVVEEDRLPRSLLRRFAGRDRRSSVTALLRFLLPLTMS